MKRLLSSIRRDLRVVFCFVVFISATSARWGLASDYCIIWKGIGLYLNALEFAQGHGALERTQLVFILAISLSPRFIFTYVYFISTNGIQHGAFTSVIYRDYGESSVSSEYVDCGSDLVA